jgi:Kef-type K+ transport system membrane component KefB
VWERRKAIGAQQGQLFVDVAELDDISGVLLMALLFAVLPTLQTTFAQAQGARPAGQTQSAPQVAPIAEALELDVPPEQSTPATQATQHAAGAAGAPTTQSQTAPATQPTPTGLTRSLLWVGGWVLAKLAVFVVLCYLFARYLSSGLVRLSEKLEPATDAVITLTALGVVLAGLAGVLGFSVAIGAFFAGLAFSQQREHVMVKTPFRALHTLFVPFFFVGIGLNTAPTSIGGALWPAVLLLLAAVVGKLLGTVLPGLIATGFAGAAVLGASMVPRAEITMIIMDRGLQLGDWAVDAQLFSATVIMAAVTCIIAPPVLQALIGKCVTTDTTAEGR